MNKKFDDFDDDFERGYNRTKALVLTAWLFQAVLLLGGCAFIGWVIVKIMQFFGIT